MQTRNWVSWLKFRGVGKPLQFLFDQHMAAGKLRMPRDVYRVLIRH